MFIYLSLQVNIFVFLAFLFVFFSVTEYLSSPLKQNKFASFFFSFFCYNFLFAKNFFLKTQIFFFHQEVIVTKQYPEDTTVWETNSWEVFCFNPFNPISYPTQYISYHPSNTFSPYFFGLYPQHISHKHLPSHFKTLALPRSWYLFNLKSHSVWSIVQSILLY